MSSQSVSLTNISPSRKNFLLVLFCFAQFLDTFNTSALFAAIPAISVSLGINNSQSVWLNSAYQLTFAALLLVSGRLSDIYNPKYVFLCGAFPLGLLALGTGFVKQKVAMLVIRALSGIAASLTIPSSLHLLVHMFPEPAAQAKAVSAFSGSGALGNLLGLVIGALYISYATWPWIFWTVAIIALLISFLCLFLIPNPGQSTHGLDAVRQFRQLDTTGVSILTVALILFIFAVTSGSVDGWVTAAVLAPLIISIFVTLAFFVWEAHIPEEHAALPPRIWRYKNFTVLAALALVPYAWWSVIYLLFSWYWQEVVGWSAIMSAVHFLPIGLVAFPFFQASGTLQQKYPTKMVLLVGLMLMLIGTILLPFGGPPHRYWPIVFPGFCIGTAGTTVVFASTNIAIFAVTPSKVAGTVGAVFNCALQLSTAVVSSAATSIQTSVQPSPNSFSGRAAGIWFLLAYVAAQTILFAIFFKGPLFKLPVHAAELGVGSGDHMMSHSALALKKIPSGTEEHRTTAVEAL